MSNTQHPNHTVKCRALAEQAVTIAPNGWDGDYDCMIGGEAVSCVMDADQEDRAIDWRNTVIDLLTPLFVQAYEEGRLSVLGDLSEPVKEIP